MPAPGTLERVRRMILDELARRGHARPHSRLSRAERLEVSLRVSHRLLEGSDAGESSDDGGETPSR